MEIQRITSFSVDHDVLTPGFYISRADGDVTTYDLRTRKPNAGDYMSNAAMHSVEHMTPRQFHLRRFCGMFGGGTRGAPRPAGGPERGNLQIVQNGEGKAY